MHLYLLSCPGHIPDESMRIFLKEKSLAYEEVEFAGDHAQIAALFSQRPGGIVFLPAMWEDLLCVKVVQEIGLLPGFFEAVVIGGTPDLEHLTVLFNEGVGGYLMSPVDERLCQAMITRLGERLKRRRETAALSERVLELETRLATSAGAAADRQQHRILGKAYLDLKNQAGPFAKDMEVLLISTSQVQRERMKGVLKALGMEVITAESIQDALERLRERPIPIVISDNILPDGDGLQLARSIRQSSEWMPKVIILSSSAEKMRQLLQPGNYIDEVVLKTIFEAGPESVIPPVVKMMYSAV